MKSQTDSLYVGWYDNNQHFWYPIGQISVSDANYRFQYLEGAVQAKQRAGFRGIFQFPDFYQVYESSELFPFFSNRLLTFSRDNFDEEVARLGLGSRSKSLRPFDVLSRTNGRRVTDTFEVYPSPDVTDGAMEIVFFVRGVRYLDADLKQRWEKGEPPRQPLTMKWDKKNEYDPFALQILDADGNPLGFIPRYYSESIHHLMNQGYDFQLQILQHNCEPGFVRERFLIRLEIAIPADWSFPQSSLYNPLSGQSLNQTIVA